MVRFADSAEGATVKKAIDDVMTEGNGGGSDRIEIFDSESLKAPQALLEAQAGKMDVLYNVTVDPATETWYGNATQRLATGRAQEYEFEIGGQIRYKLITPPDPPKNQETEFSDIVDFAKATGRKLACKPGNIQCGGKCQSGKKNCFVNMPDGGKAAKAAARKAATKNKGDSEKIGDLTKAQMGAEVAKSYGVKRVEDLPGNANFRMGEGDYTKEDLRRIDVIAKLYRSNVGVIPNDPANAPGVRGVVNGINVFHNFRPWNVFGVNPQDPKYSVPKNLKGAERKKAEAAALKARTQDVKKAYRQLALKYHPDNSDGTGDREVFERLDKYYKSVTATFE